MTATLLGGTSRTLNSFITKKTYRLVFRVALFVPAALGAFQQATAQTFPTGIIRIVVPFSAATPPDILARIVADSLSRDEGWKVVVENKPGAVMSIGAMEVLRQPADGHTVFAANMPIAPAATLLPNAPFKYDTDFVPLIRVATGYNVLVVNPSVPANSVAELVAYLKKNPAKFTFSSGGFGTPAHLLGELFKLETGVDTTHVPYVQFPQAIGDLISGVNTYQFITILPVMQLIKTGQLRALAVAGTKRIAELPEVPTIVEAGYPSLASEDWAGLLLKAGTPPEIIKQFNAAINRTLMSEKVLIALAKIGTDAGGGTPEDFGTTVRLEIARWGKIVKDANIKIAQ